ncbi:MAG: DUF4070 domain-containing protein [Bacteroidetes bacterium]|nr:DUF4070 domain-containing protein [Bacteroidota bacterium]
MPKALLVYPEYPVTFWSFKYALKFIHRKAAFPPLGLLTIAALLPDDWKTELVDLNVRKLTDKQLQSADFVLISAMNVQRQSALQVIDRCMQYSKKIIGGGPLFTEEYSEFEQVDYLVLNEAEITLPIFLDDLQKGNPKHVYSTEKFADLSLSPIPKWSLINMHNYATMNLQYSRGCPYNCEFCDITRLFGHKVRTKSRDQLIAELDALHSNGWHDDIFMVDDNFIGNKAKLKQEILPSMQWWQSKFRTPHTFNTQVSIDLADDPDLMSMMSLAGFTKVFIGIETPNAESLTECNKTKNVNRDLLGSIGTLQRAGFEVAGGFIVGFDHDPDSIFDTQARFIQRSGVVTAMVGLLNALPGTKLFRRLHLENRILKRSTGDNMDFSMNFIPKITAQKLISGYQDLLQTLYSPKVYYARVKTFLRVFRKVKRKSRPLSLNDLYAFVKSAIRIGLFSRSGVQYWKLIIWTLVHRPRLLTSSVTFSIYGYHFRKTLRLNIKALSSVELD